MKARIAKKVLNRMEDNSEFSHYGLNRELVDRAVRHVYNWRTSGYRWKWCGIRWEWQQCTRCGSNSVYTADRVCSKCFRVSPRAIDVLPPYTITLGETL